jgi:hypothetical protein
MKNPIRLERGAGDRLGMCEPLSELVPEVGAEPTRFI